LPPGEVASDLGYQRDGTVLLTTRGLDGGTGLLAIADDASTTRLVSVMATPPDWMSDPHELPSGAILVYGEESRYEWTAGTASWQPSDHDRYGWLTYTRMASSGAAPTA
jgi:hypothetical protein